jgi:glycosyltransferase involved in cell wall biosynthesis
MPRVTVVIPTHNRRDLVREAVGTVLAQTFCDFELIVVDDGSTDGTAEALGGLGGLRCLRQDHRGVSAARNRGVREGRGELVAFLDSDDLWHPRKLEIQTAFMDGRPDAKVCQTEEIWVRGGKRVNPCAKHRKPSGDIFAPSLDLCLVSPSAVMMRRGLFERLGGFDESLPACEDYDLWLRVAAEEEVFLISRPLVVRRGGHADQLSRRFWGMDRFRVAALVKLLASGRLSPEKRRLALSALAKKCAILARGAAKRGHYESARRYLEIAASCERVFGGCRRDAVGAAPIRVTTRGIDSGRQREHEQA